MRRTLLLCLLVSTACARGAPVPAPAAGSASTRAASAEVAGWERRARGIDIVRDDWGIAHVYGKTDADVVFGMMYAQAEDDFTRVETNYINAMGRLAEAEGEREIWRDLRMKLFIDPDSMRAMYARSPAWLQTLMNAYADGLNYYLHTHPDVRPRVIRRFEPWMALTFSEGSIGGDIERVSLPQLEAFYGKPAAAPRAASESDVRPKEPSGSNGIAIAPSNTTAGRALLLINPHTSFFFRSELQAVSEEGLDAYGAVTWGQFFVYQGFNDRLGWMHTSSGVDNVDEYAETVIERGDRFFYRYGGEACTARGECGRPMTASRIAVPYRTPSGAMATREFTVYRTHHGPIVRSAEGKWVSIRLMQKPIEALSQSFLRTKARDYTAFRDVMALKANSSNNTIYADADGNIAYFHPHFIPRRDDRFDWTRPVDGSDPATEWQGLHGVEDSPFLKNPPNGWIMNTNDWPYSAAGANSPKREDFPRYMDQAGENPRGLHALRVLEGRTDFSLDALLAAAFDSYLPAFAQMLPPLVRDYDALPASDPLRATLADQIAALRDWDYRWSAASVPTSLAVYWGEEMFARVAGEVRRRGGGGGLAAYDHIATRAAPAERLEALSAASARLARDFGSWRTPWGDINRFQRLTGDIVQRFDDRGPSIPVPFTSAQWGSLASFGARTYPGTKRMYGTSGNSFVAVVEFGRDSVRARAVTAGGESGHPASRHFTDQATRYATGNLREVYFYRPQLRGHTERSYHPGQ